MGNLFCSGLPNIQTNRRNNYFERNGTTRRSDKAITQTDFLNLVKECEGGEQVFVCSYSRWYRSLYQKLCFSVNADYVGARPSHRRFGSVAKPDLQNGRNIQAELLSKRYIRLWEGRSSMRIEIPGTLFPDNRPLAERELESHYFRDFTEILPENSLLYYGLARVIGFRTGTCVVKCCDPKRNRTPQIIVVHFTSKSVFAKISLEDVTGNTGNDQQEYQEAYISRDLSQILIRPEDTPRRTPQFQNYTQPIVKKHSEPDTNLEIIFVQNFPGALTFDNRHANRYLFQAYLDTLYLIDLKSENLEVVEWEQMTNLDAEVVQIKSSHSGQYLAVRCVNPTRVGEFHPCLLNFIYIIAADNFQTLFCCDAKGPYWPISEVINYQVFPCFSTCDTLVSFMKNTSSKRKVFIYKLPVTKTSLQNTCRSVILRQLGSFKNIDSLNLPNQIKQFLRYEL